MAAKSAMGANPVAYMDAYDRPNPDGLVMAAAPRTVSTVSFAPEPPRVGPSTPMKVIDTVEALGAALELTHGEKCALLYVLDIDARLWPTEGIPEGHNTILKNEFLEAQADRPAQPHLAIVLDWANGFITGKIKTGLTTFLLNNDPPDHVAPIDASVWRDAFIKTYTPTRLDFQSERKSGSGFVIGGIFLVLLALAALAYLTLR